MATQQLLSQNDVYPWLGCNTIMIMRDYINVEETL